MFTQVGLSVQAVSTQVYHNCSGLVEAVGKELFDQKVTLTVVDQTHEETAAKIVLHHTVFRVCDNEFFPAIVRAFLVKLVLNYVERK